MFIAFCIDFTMVDQESLISWSFSLVQVHDWTQKLNTDLKTSELVEVDIRMFWWHKSVKVCFKLHPPGRQAVLSSIPQSELYDGPSAEDQEASSLSWKDYVKTFSQCSSHWKVPSPKPEGDPFIKSRCEEIVKCIWRRGEKVWDGVHFHTWFW